MEHYPVHLTWLADAVHRWWTARICVRSDSSWSCCAVTGMEPIVDSANDGASQATVPGSILGVCAQEVPAVGEAQSMHTLCTEGCAAKVAYVCAADCRYCVGTACRGWPQGLSAHDASWPRRSSPWTERLDSADEYCRSPTTVVVGWTAHETGRTARCGALFALGGV